MPSVVNCPSCERRLRVPEGLVGEQVKCPTCGETFTADPDSPPPRRQEEEPRPAARDTALPRPGRDDGDGEEPRPRPARSRRRDEDDSDEDHDRRPRRRRLGREKPGKVQAVGVMMLIGGILAIMLFVFLFLFGGIGSMGLCCVWPGTYYSLIMGILAVIKGSQILGDNAHLQAAPRGTAVMMIINILNLDVTNLAMGIVCLVLLNEPEVERYFRG
jgi:hypothetical protein